MNIKIKTKDKIEYDLKYSLLSRMSSRVRTLSYNLESDYIKGPDFAKYREQVNDIIDETENAYHNIDRFTEDNEIPKVEKTTRLRRFLSFGGSK